ncbi:MAG: hypothetical protein IJK23_12710 [Clostridia bacterium]|nr:hypothetical protein [Clostridia bacterium]
MIFTAAGRVLYGALTVRPTGPRSKAAAVAAENCPPDCFQRQLRVAFRQAATNNYLTNIKLRSDFCISALRSDLSSRKPAASSRKPEAGSQQPEAGSQHPHAPKK